MYVSSLNGRMTEWVTCVLDRCNSDCFDLATYVLVCSPQGENNFTTSVGLSFFGKNLFDISYKLLFSHLQIILIYLGTILLTFYLYIALFPRYLTNGMWLLISLP